MNTNTDTNTDTNTNTNTDTNIIELEIKEYVSETVEPTTIPKIVFIIPYRDRVEHKEFFTIYMKHVLEDIPKTDYEIYFVEQKNTLPFNRGAMKNIGFLALKYKYPNDYKNITFVFNDVDTVPYSKNVIDYDTVHGIVKHFYGFRFALGGIFSIKGEDFERTNGFPNFWAWGGEDNYMQKRVEYVGLYIDRSVFFNILDKNILQLCDGVKRLICRKEAATVVNMTTSDGIITIRNLNYEFKDEYINVYNFQTMRDPRVLRFEEQNIAIESKIRLEKEDVKNILDRKMNKNIGVHNNNIHAPHQREPIQHQNVVLPRRPLTAPLPPPSPPPHQQPRQQPQPHPQPQPQPRQQPQPHPQPQPQPRQQPQPHPQPQPQPRQLKKYVYRGIGMGGIH
jgi:hypothetical protein